jgi:hypothetical protein
LEYLKVHPENSIIALKTSLLISVKLLFELQVIKRNAFNYGAISIRIPKLDI